MIRPWRARATSGTETACVWRASEILRAVSVDTTGGRRRQRVAAKAMRDAEASANGRAGAEGGAGRGKALRKGIVVART